MTARGLIWLASYPKSGNTWTRLFLAEFLNESEDDVDVNAIDVGIGIASNRRAFDEAVGVASSDLTDDEVDRLRPAVYRLWAETPRERALIVKVHDANRQLDDGTWLFPPEVSRVAVHLVRNPLDVVISNAYHSGHEDLDRAIRNLNDPDQDMAGANSSQLRQRLLDWSTHTRSWQSTCGYPSLTVRYEDLLADPHHGFASIVDFLGLPGADDQARISRAVERTSFDRLREAEVESGFRERTARQKQFFRSGTTGEWRDRLTLEQIDLVVGQHREVMAELGYLDTLGHP